MNEINTKLYKTASLTSFRLSSKVYDGGVVVLRGEVPFLYHKKLAGSIANNIEGVKKIENEIVVVNTLQDPMQISANIAYLLKGFNLQNGVNITYTFDYETLILKGNVWNKTLKQTLLEKLKELRFINKIEDKIKILPPKIDTKIYFEKASVHLSTKAQTKLVTLLTLLKNVDSSYTLTLTSYSDQIGTVERNRILSKQRLSSIETFLKNQGELKNKIQLIIQDTPPNDVDVTKNPEKARTVIITYASGDNNVSL
ncbi:MAG: BON domain-containing protein [Sulfurimonas sp.]